MSKVQIIIEGDDAEDALHQIKRFAAGLVTAEIYVASEGAGSPTPVSPAPAKASGGRKKAEPAAPPAQAEPAADPFAASPAPAESSSTSPADSGSAGDTSAADTSPAGDEPTYDELKAAMSAALERAEPLAVSEALYKATGAKALKQLTTTGVAGGPMKPGVAKAALAALEAVGRS